MRQKPEKKEYTLFILIIFILAIFTSINGFADTIQLKDGSLLVGKIISREKGKMTFSNSYGVFSFKITQIQKKFKTKNYRQDIKIFKNLGHPITPELVNNIKNNYLEGVKKKAKIEKMASIGEKPETKDLEKEMKQQEKERLEEEKRRKKEMEKQDRKREKELRKLKEKAEKERKKELKRKAKEERKKMRSKSNLWVNGRLSFSGSFLYTFGEINDIVPYGFTGNFAIDQGLDMAIKKRFALMPGIRFEFGYIYFKKGKAVISGYSAYTGLCWALPSMKNSWGNFYLAMLPGIAFIDIEKVQSDYKVTSYTLIAQALFGYQYSIGVFTVFLHAKYLYIYDKDVLFNAFGFEAGIGFNAW